MPLFLLAILQSVLYAAGPVLLKMGLARMLPFEWSWPFWRSVFFNLPFGGSGICYALGTVLWFYMVKHYPLSMAYPLVSLSYIFGMIAAVVVFHEPVSVVKWIGVVLIVLGCYFIVK